MKKNSYFKSISFILTVFLTFLMLSGCQNFLKGTDIKDQLEEIVDYASKPEVNIKIISDHGRISPAAVFTKNLMNHF